MRTLSAALCLLAIAAVSPAAAPPARPPADAWGDPLPEGAVARLGSVRFRLGGTYDGSVALSPDGKLIATFKNGDQTRIALIDSVTGLEVRSFVARTHSNLAFSADSKTLLGTSSGDRFACFYDVAQGKETYRIKWELSGANVFVLSADQSVFAVTERSIRAVPVVLYAAKTGKQLASLTTIHNQWLDLALSPDGKRLVTYGSVSLEGDGGKQREEEARIARTIQLWDTATAKEWKQIDLGLDGSPSCVAFLPDGRTLVVTDTSGELQHWDVMTGKRLERWRGPFLPVSKRLIVSPDGKYLVRTPRQCEGQLAIWDLKTGRRLPAARSPDCSTYDVGFRDGRIIALGLRSQALIVWDVLSGKRFDVNVGHSSAPIATAFRKGRISTACPTGEVIEWDLTGRPIETMPAPRSYRGWDSRPRRSSLILFSPCGEYVASDDGDLRRLAVRYVTNGEEVFSSQDGLDPFSAFSPDSKLVAISDYEYTRRRANVSVLRLDSGKVALSFDPGAAEVVGLAIDPSGKRLAVGLVRDGGADVIVWRMDVNRQDDAFVRCEVTGLRGYRPKLPMTFSPDGSFLAVTPLDGDAIHLLDGASGKRRGRISTDPVILPPVFSPDGRSLAVIVSRAEASVLTLWELRSGKKRWEVNLPAQPTALTFDPSGRLLLSAHADTTAMLWDVSGQWRTDKVRDKEGWDRLVKDLSSEDAQKAFAAQRALAAVGNLSVAQMAKRVKPAAGRPLSEKEIAALLKDLDDDDPDVRGKAADALAQQRMAAEPALRKALAGKPSAQLRRSAAALLDRLRQASPEELHASRTVEVLEWIATPEARRLLAHLADGRPSATLTQEAKAALSRLSAP